MFCSPLFTSEFISEIFYYNGNITCEPIMRIYMCILIYYANGDFFFVPIRTLKLYNLTTQYKHDQNVCVGV
jgi:hypothetical protein